MEQHPSSPMKSAPFMHRDTHFYAHQGPRHHHHYQKCPGAYSNGAFSNGAFSNTGDVACFLHQNHIDNNQPQLWQGTGVTATVPSRDRFVHSLARHDPHRETNRTEGFIVGQEPQLWHGANAHESYQYEGQQDSHGPTDQAYDSDGNNIAIVSPGIFNEQNRDEHIVVKHEQVIVDISDDFDNAVENNVSMHTGSTSCYRKSEAKAVNSASCRASMLQPTSATPDFPRSISNAPHSPTNCTTFNHSHRHLSTPPRYPCQPSNSPSHLVHFDGETQSKYFYRNPCESAQRHPQRSSLRSMHPFLGSVHYTRPSTEQCQAPCDEFDRHLPSQPALNFPNAQDEEYIMGFSGWKSLEMKEQAMVQSRTETRTTAPISAVVSSDTHDGRVPIADNMPPIPIGAAHHSRAGQIVQTPEGPALLLLAANIPSPAAVRPFLVLHPPRHGSSPTTTTVAAAASTTSTLVVEAAALPNGPKRRFQRWTDEEDNLLRDACSAETGPPFNWVKIASHYFRNERSPTQCKSRWGKALQPGIHRGKWQPEEDALVIQLKQDGLSFSEIAKQVDGRTAEHIRERWISTLDPSNRYEPWTEREVKTLFEAQARIGNKWSEIAKLLPGRSEIAVKNRYHNAKTAERRKVRRLAADMMQADRLQRARYQRKVIAPPTSCRSSDDEVVDAAASDLN